MAVAASASEKKTGEEAEGEQKAAADDQQKVSFYKLFSFADRLDVVLMTAGIIAAIANGMSQPLMMLIFGKLVNSFGSSTRSNVIDEISGVSLNFLYLAIGTGIAAFLQVACWMVTGERQAIRIRGLYLRTILRQDIAFFDTETTTGEVIGRMSGDTILIQDAMGEKVGKFIQLVSTFFGGFVIAFVKGWLLSLVLLSCIPAIVITVGILATVMSKMSSSGQLAYAEAANVVEQTVGAIRTVTSFTGEKRAIEKYNIKLDIAYKSSIQQGLLSGLGLGIALLIIFGTYGLAIWSLGQASPCLNAFASGQAAAYKMFETIQRKPKIDAYDDSGIVLEDIRGEIELKDVHFRYPARPDVQIFSGFSLHVPSGKTAALVGQSGSGKSTVISLLERFYDPDSGEVLIDGVDLKKLKLKFIREKIGLVSQEPVLFATTIRENIYYGKENASEEEIRTAIELANAAKFIDKLPKGLDTLAGEHGTQLSGGQKQRIAIARAILKNPRILLLDEATSALDSESERVVQEALERVMEYRTTVVVAHRLTTIRDADIIAVVQQGKLVEQGTHVELIKDPEGAYTQLVRLQEGANEMKNTRDSDIEKANTSLDLGTGGPLKVSIKRLAYLNKPELPVLLLGSIAAIANVASTAQNFLFGVAGGKLIQRIRSMSFEKVVHQEISWFDNAANSSGAIGARLSTDASTIKGLVGDSLALVAQNITTLVAALIIAFASNWILAFIVLAVSPILVLQGIIKKKFLVGFSADAKVMYEEASQVANDAVSSIRTVASFCAEKKVIEMYRKKCEGPESQGVRLGLLFLRNMGKQHLEKFSSNGVSQTSTMAPDINKAKDSATSIFSILDGKPKIDSSSDEGTTLPTIKGDIEFEHVSFKYPTRPDIQIFRDFCLSIPSGKTVALVGESGSGKSTAISLIERFYDPDSGGVTLDGVEIKKLKLSWLRQQMGLVSQEPVLFNETIRDNIAYGKQGDVTEEEMISVTKAANAHDFVSSLPDGYNTFVGERGIQLSGGQKQRIAIARAIVKNPKILLLDEATSALDAESERVVQNALDRVMVDRTTVVIAHRLTTIKGADIIAVVKDGVIAEKGTHDFLVKIDGGAYASLLALHMTSST
ncbi:hypothetical protein FNV43_RR01350 [Rhamnella rubrinervis]|uniref:Uncharacterized protein n=2 Tax=Rhamnella rubrinervis TaxID=2594499 RepID=A0A8K0MRZ0_9ROSA|nr:hypothetical protein FNV43_RR01350 [Rhamnella rubrinervis]